MQVSPMPRPRARIHELTWAGVAPTAPAAWKTITAELANPTSTVTKPAVTADTDRSRARDTRPLYTPRVRAYLLSRLRQTVLVVFLSLNALFFLIPLRRDSVLPFLAPGNPAQ